MAHVEPLHEEERLAVLASYDILDTPPERMFDDIALAASKICDVPIALISLVADTRQWFKAAVGLEATETPVEYAFCKHAIANSEPRAMIVPDARKDERFADNPLVRGEPHISFYAGAPLVAPTGHKLGTLCLIDQRPREVRPDQVEALEALANLVVDGLEHRRVSRTLAGALERVQTLESLLQMCANCKSVRVEGAEWVPFEEHLHKQSGTLVSHGVCPNCL